MAVTRSLIDDLVKKMTNLRLQGIGRFRSTCQDLWLLGKQAWYVPFLWSLAWFSYWVFHDAIVLKQVTQGTPSDLLGVSISISALLFAGYISGKSITKIVVEKATGVAAMLGKKFPFSKFFDDNKVTRILPQKLQQEMTVKESQRSEPEIELEAVEIDSEEEFYENPDEPVQPSVSPHSLLSHARQPHEGRKIQEISADCLICPNLLRCNERQNRGVEFVTRCPLAR